MNNIPLGWNLDLKLRNAENLNNKLLETLKEFYDAEWMVSHEWGGDRDSILSKVEKLLKDNGKLND